MPIYWQNCKFFSFKTWTRKLGTYRAEREQLRACFLKLSNVFFFLWESKSKSRWSFFWLRTVEDKIQIFDEIICFNFTLNKNRCWTCKWNDLFGFLKWWNFQIKKMNNISFINLSDSIRWQDLIFDEIICFNFTLSKNRCWIC